VLGLGLFLERLGDRPRLLACVGLGFATHTGLLMIQYQAFMKGLRELAPYPDTFHGLWIARFSVPWELLRAWLRSG
jgi:hypothetical protein